MKAVFVIVSQTNLQFAGEKIKRDLIAGLEKREAELLSGKKPKTSIREGVEFAVDCFVHSISDSKLQ